MFRKTEVVFGIAALGIFLGLFATSCGRSSDTEKPSQITTTAPTNQIKSSPPSTAVTYTNIPIPGAGSLQFTVPAGWRTMVQPSSKDGVPTKIQFSNQEGSNFAMDVAVLFDPENRLSLDAKSASEKALEKARPSALETSLFVQDLMGPEFSGHYFSITDKLLADRTPNPGQFKYMTRGNAKFSRLVMSFKILSNNPSGEDRKTALEMLRNIRLVHP